MEERERKNTVPFGRDCESRFDMENVELNSQEIFKSKWIMSLHHSHNVSLWPFVDSASLLAHYIQYAVRWDKILLCHNSGIRRWQTDDKLWTGAWVYGCTVRSQAVMDVFNFCRMVRYAESCHFSTSVCLHLRTIQITCRPSCTNHRLIMQNGTVASQFNLLSALSPISRPVSVGHAFNSRAHRNWFAAAKEIIRSLIYLTRLCECGEFGYAYLLYASHMI